MSTSAETGCLLGKSKVSVFGCCCLLPLSAVIVVLAVTVKILNNVGNRRSLPQESYRKKSVISHPKTKFQASHQDNFQPAIFFTNLLSTQYRQTNSNDSYTKSTLLKKLPTTPYKRKFHFIWFNLSVPHTV